MDPNEDIVKVYLDQNQIIYLNKEFDITTRYTGIGFGAATGGATNYHIIDNVILRKYVVEPSVSISKEERLVSYEGTWKYKVPLTIIEKSGNSLIDYRVELHID